jgi:hypothetical protein
MVADLPTKDLGKQHVKFSKAMRPTSAQSKESVSSAECEAGVRHWGINKDEWNSLGTPRIYQKAVEGPSRG